MRKSLVGLAIMALLLCGGTATASQQSRAQINFERIISALDSPEMAKPVAAALSANSELQIPEKKVPSKDATTISLIGTVVLTETDFLSDGTPITVGLMNVNLPIHQQVYFSCIGGSIWVQCIPSGRRKLDGFLLAGDDVAFDSFLNLVIVTKLTK
jgi:hypothetical protein